MVSHLMALMVPFFWNNGRVQKEIGEGSNLQPEMSVFAIAVVSYSKSIQFSFFISFFNKTFFPFVFTPSFVCCLLLLCIIETLEF